MTWRLTNASITQQEENTFSITKLKEDKTLDILFQLFPSSLFPFLSLALAPTFSRSLSLSLALSHSLKRKRLFITLNVSSAFMLILSDAEVSSLSLSLSFSLLHSLTLSLSLFPLSCSLKTRPSHKFSYPQIHFLNASRSSSR